MMAGVRSDVVNIIYPGASLRRMSVNWIVLIAAALLPRYVI